MNNARTTRRRLLTILITLVSLLALATLTVGAEGWTCGSCSGSGKCYNCGGDGKL